MTKIKNIVWLEFEDFAKMHALSEELGVASNVIIASLVKVLNKDEIKELVKEEIRPYSSRLMSF
ncbi:MAG: hypothetical protein KatS3mg003_0936 [Candidatus Nitrosocaldaceae archaeon]|nr:MAG: hypothetical protein KatS3mg003_0936 [Candidatus Nitrosocaldaceae archaeon]